MTDDKPDPVSNDPFGAEIAATMRAHEQPGPVDDIIEALRAEHGALSRRRARDKQKRRSAVVLTAASVVVVAGVTGLLVAGASTRGTATSATPTSAAPTNDTVPLSGLEALVVRPGEQVRADGLGGIVRAEDGSTELCSGYSTQGTSGKPVPSGYLDPTGTGCEGIAAIKIATLRAEQAGILEIKQGEPVQVTGTYETDGSITVTDVHPLTPPTRIPDRATPCPTPEGGWQVRNGDTGALNRYLAQDPGEYLSFGTTPQGKGYGVFTVGTLTRDLTTTRTELEKIYGAPVCVYRATHSERQLTAATSGAALVLRNSGTDLWDGPYNTTSPNLPLNPDSDTSIGYVLAITPALAQQLQPYSEFIKLVPFIAPMPLTGQPSPAVSATASAPVTAPSSTPADDSCLGSAREGVDAPLAAYGDTDSAKLHFAGGAPPTARLCGSFESLGKRQSGSARSTPSSMAYLFSLVLDGKVSSGGSYYWVAYAVDSTVASVVISFAETPQTVTVTLVPLATGWQGFAFEYSPGPFYYAPSSRNVRGPQNAGLTVTARDHAGNVVDSRYINLDNNEQREAGTQPTS